MFIRTQRLFLRPGWPEDWHEIRREVADQAVVRNLSDVPWPYTDDDARRYAGASQDRLHPHFLVTLPGASGTRVVGALGLKPGADCAEVGYWIGRDHWGRGYATEALRGVLSLARTIGHRRLAARHFVDNPASGRVLRKAGFVPSASGAICTSAARSEAGRALAYHCDLDAPADCDGDMRKRAA